jgi:hypothetical protein
MPWTVTAREPGTPDRDAGHGSQLAGGAPVTARHVWRKGSRCDRCGLVRRMTCVGSWHLRGLWYFREGQAPTLTRPPCVG